MSIIRSARNTKRAPGDQNSRLGSSRAAQPAHLRCRGGDLRTSDAGGRAVRGGSGAAGLAEGLENLAQLEGLADPACDTGAGVMGGGGAADQEDGDVGRLAAQGGERAAWIGLDGGKIDQGDVYLRAQLRKILQLRAAGERIELYTARAEAKLEQRHHRGVILQHRYTQAVQHLEAGGARERRGGCIPDGPAQLEASASATIEQGQVAAAALRQIVRVGEADAGAARAARGARRKDALALIRWNTGAVVPHSKQKA